MTGFVALALAMLKGFYRDRLTLFFTVFFPLFFILIFGVVFGGGGTASKQKLIPVGDVAFITALPAQARAGFDEVFDLQPAEGLDAALAAVRTGDAAAAVEQRGDALVVHVSRADQVAAATVQGVLSSFVDTTNLAVAQVQPTYSLQVTQVEDESLKGIQYVAPGMISYGITIGATFGAALTLITWRNSKLLRRLRLAPVATGAVVGARVVVSLVVAVFQLVLLIGVSMLLGLRLSGAWYMAIPLTIAGTLAFLAIGLLVGSIAKTSEGGSGLANLITLPMGFLSGAFIPLIAAPGWLIVISKIMPMGYLVSGLSDVLVRGQGPSSALLPILILLGFAAGLTFIATRLFRWDAA
ncbi:MAG: ABC transporter permease [Nakamurella sp.]